MLARITAVFFMVIWSPLSSAVGRQSQPGERFEKADVLYDWVSNTHGDKLRTFFTRPKKLSGKVPVLFLVGWLSCDSVEYVQGETAGFSSLIVRRPSTSSYRH